LIYILPLTLRKEEILMVSEKKVQRRIFRYKEEEVIGDRHNEELHNMPY
jgi:hypothetical protein